MTTVRTLLSCALLAALLALAVPVASLAYSNPTWVPRPEQRAAFLLVLAKDKHKKLRSCNKGDDRRGQTNAAVDAWAVACEFPPRSEPNWVSSAKNATAPALAGGA